jgi:putative ABC transport system permease protein
MSLLARSSFRYLLRHPWLVALSVIGVALGVAVVVSIDLANASASRAFAMSTEAVVGRATHLVSRPDAPVDDDVYRLVRVEAGVTDSAPVIEGYVTTAGRTLQVLGIDPLAEAPFRGYTSEQGFDLGRFIRDDAVLMSAEVAQALEAEAGDSIFVTVDGVERSLFLLDILDPPDASARRNLENLILVDISTAQRLFDMHGLLSRVDVMIGEEDTELMSRLHGVLPAGVRVERSEARTEIVEDMTRAFELNLAALSLLALIVGMFLIYNTMTFSIVQRRVATGRMKALGVTGREVMRIILVEALIIGIAGTALGLAAGILLAGTLVDLVSQTINDLYFALTVREVAINPLIIFKGASLGILATVGAAALPALEAARQPATITLQRSSQETGLRDRAPLFALAGVAILATAVIVLLVSGQSIVLSYVGMLLLIVGASLLTPLALMFFSKIARPAAGAAFGVVGRMAAGGLVTFLSRLGVAAAALMVAIAATIGVGVMIDSFRQTVDVWLTQTLQADVYIQPATRVARVGEGSLSPEVVDRVRALPIVEGVYTVRTRRTERDGRLFDLVAIDPGPEEGANYRFKEGNRQAVWPDFVAGDAVLVSEPFSFRFGVAAGDQIELATDHGVISLPVGGVYFDYGSDLGNVVLSRTGYERYFDDRGYSGVSLRLRDGIDVDGSLAEIRAELARLQEVFVRSNRGLRELSLDIFDRTFTITIVLRMLIVLVAFIGVLTALMALQMERHREMAVMRAQGFTPGQIRRYVALQSGLAGFSASILALPLGLALATVLVYVINKRSFGWTLQFNVAPEILLQALVLGTLAALLAAIYPGWKMSRSDASVALREE